MVEPTKNTFTPSTSFQFVDCESNRKLKDKHYSCDLCEKSFLLLNHLTAHKMFHIGEKQFQCKLCKKSFCSDSDLLLHKKSASHLKMLHLSNNIVTPPTSTSFDDCDGADIKLEMKEEETLDEDPLSIKLEDEYIEIGINS